MIHVDDREGRLKLVRPLQQLGAVCTSTRLPFGDVAFPGHGPEGIEQIGIEIKETSDLLSSLASGRLVAHQLAGMQDGAYDRSYLLTVGQWRPGDDGTLTVPRRGGWVSAGFGRRRWTYAGVIRQLSSLEAVGVTWLRAVSRPEAAWLVWSLYTWWQDPWEAHSTVKAFHKSPPPRRHLRRPSAFRTFLAAIPGIDWEYTYAAEDAFVTPVAACTASVEAWAQLRPDGRTRAGRLRPCLGRSRAEHVVDFLRGDT